MSRSHRNSAHPDINPETVARAVGSRLQVVRQKFGMKQDVLADAIGVSRITMSNIERGVQRLSIDQLYLAAQILQTTVGDLLPPLESITTRARVITAIDEPLGKDTMEGLLNVIDELSAAAKPAKKRGADR